MVLLLVATTTTVTGNEDKKLVPPLDGSYVVVAIEKGGEKIPREKLKDPAEENQTIVIKGNKLIPTKNSTREPLELKLDPSKTPAEIDTKETKGDNPETSYGIYKLEGDTLIICIVQDCKPSDRPKEFKTSKDSKAILLTLKKKDK